MKFFFAQLSNQTLFSLAMSGVLRLSSLCLPSHFYRDQQQHDGKVALELVRR